MHSSAPRTRLRVAAALTALAVATGTTTGLGTATSPANAARPAETVESAQPGRWQPPGAGEWWQDALNLPAAREQATGKGVTVAVIDSGINLALPEFRGADVAMGDDSCADALPTEPTTDPSAAHGTEMAAVIVGQGRGNAAGGRGRLGVAPDARLLVFQNAGPSGICPGAFLGRLLRSAVDQGADIVNISLSVNRSAQLTEAIEYANDKGVVVVAASGNRPATDRSFVYPATDAGVLTVQAIGPKGFPWKRNPLPDDGGVENDEFWPWISGPGVGVPVIGVVGGTWRSDAGTVDGTSTASAVVSGLLALLKSRYPEATGNQLLQSVLHATGDKTMSWEPQTGFGVASITRMLEQDPAGWPDENPLLMRPAEFAKKYPRSVYRAPAAGEPSAGASGDATAPDGPPATDTATDAANGGIPSGLLVGGGVALLLLVAAGVAFGLRGRSPGRGGGGPPGRTG